MNRIVVSVPRVLDSAMVILHDATHQVGTGNLPATATAPFTVKQVKTTPTETQMTNTTVTPLSDHTNCSRVTADITIPITLTITDANGTAYETFTTATKSIDIVLFVPRNSAFPYIMSCEGTLDAVSATADATTTTLTNVTFKLLVRETAVTDLLIPTYGYAPLNRAGTYSQSFNDTFLNQPLFPAGRIY